MIIIDSVPQNSEEWFRLRFGSIGGSSISAIAAQGTGMKGEMYKLASELLTGVRSEGPKFKYADRGHEFEDEARSYYEFEHNADTRQIAMVKEGDHKHYSPDSLRDENATIEIKVRIPKTYVEYSTTQKILIGDRRQVQWGLHICQREWCDYVQYCPEMKMNPMFVQRITRDEKMITELDGFADKFIGEMLELVEKIRKAA